MRKSVRNYVVYSRKIELNKYILSQTQGTQNHCPVTINYTVYRESFNWNWQLRNCFVLNKSQVVFLRFLVLIVTIFPQPARQWLSQSQWAQFLWREWPDQTGETEREWVIHWALSCSWLCLGVNKTHQTTPGSHSPWFKWSSDPSLYYIHTLVTASELSHIFSNFVKISRFLIKETFERNLMWIQ